MLNLICLEFTRPAMCSFHTINPQLQKYSFFNKQETTLLAL